MKQIICLFEDCGYRNLLPLVYLRPVYDLHCGILTLKEKIEKYFPKSHFVLHSRDYLRNVISERYSGYDYKISDNDEVIYVNGRLIVDKKIVNRISKLKTGEALTRSGEIIAAKLNVKFANQFLTSDYNLFDFQIENFSKTEFSDAKLIKYLWELIKLNGVELKRDFELLRKKSNIITRLNRHVVLINKKNIFIDKGTVVNPFVVMDASDGPIYIGRNVLILPHVTIKGPVYIGDNSLVKSHASIYHNTSIGKVCKVGGEIENSIIHSFTNKQHEGFLGNSYLGSWINIGASTNNSDLKNNYGEIELFINGKKVNSGEQFIGLIMGDHSKTAINTMFNTGTNVGVSCNIFGSGFPPKYIPSFSWGGSEWLRTYEIKKCIEVAKVVMKRRNVELSKHEELLLHNIFDITAHERKSKIL
ncbi:MAG: GlmU family protein [Bacteroidota bacterium]